MGQEALGAAGEGGQDARSGFSVGLRGSGFAGRPDQSGLAAGGTQGAQVQQGHLRCQEDCRGGLSRAMAVDRNGHRQGRRVTSYKSIKTDVTMPAQNGKILKSSSTKA